MYSNNNKNHTSFLEVILLYSKAEENKFFF